MHSYLRAVGFSDLQKKEWKEIISEVICDYDEKQVMEHEDGTSFVEISKEYGMDMGITVCGEYDENDRFVMEYAFPYFRGSKITTTEDVFVEHRLEKESYSGACEDMRLGVTLIFYLANAGTYLKERYKQNLEHYTTAVSISGLALEGKVILPIKKSSIQVDSERQKWMKREEMWNSLEREEDEETFWDKIAREDRKEISMIYKRIMDNDILTVVDTYFIPFGMECDRYRIMGEITEVSKAQNYATGENVYQLSILCNDVEFDVCINQKDLFGVPEVGRRFSGVIWTQGELHFTE